MEDLRRREGMRLPWNKGRKFLNENLAPLRRFLRSNVGRPWDKVYSEVCERINRDSAVQYHVWQHLMQDVCRDPHEVLGYVRRYAFFGRLNGFFVDPRTGLLRENKRRRRPPSPPSQEPVPAIIPIDERHEYRLLEGLWYEVELTSLPADGPVFDILLKKRWPQLSAAEFQKFYGRQVCAIRKRQLNKKEIRRLPVEK